MRTAPAVTPEQVRAVIDTVPDPEMPPVTVGDLGMVHDVRVLPARNASSGEPASGARVEVDLLPTFSGCPATQVIGDDVARAVGALHGVAEVAVCFSFDEPWTPERITDRGRQRLRRFGIAPPEAAQAPRGCLPGGGLALAQAGTRCPVCGSSDTVLDSPFGPTPCRSTHYCNDCRNPFEAVKP